MKFGAHALCLLALAGSLITATARGAERFADAVGPVRVGAVDASKTLEVPFITWGGDVATFDANGGLKTKRGSIYADLGLDLQLRPGDDFIEQVRRYVKGDSAFLRGTMRMLGQASEVIGADPRTKPVVFLQLTWSAGDHMVARGNLKTLGDLKGRTVALQAGGPHVGMLDDALRAANLSWNDITVRWAEELTGPGGPADLFRNDASIDACMVITPDMLGLSGGLEEKGSGAEGTVKDAHVLVSTAQMSRSIADVYAVRKDFFDAHRDVVEKFAAGYFKASRKLVTMRNAYDETGRGDEYEAILALAQSIYGAEVLPTLDVDAHGLLLDAAFVGLPGNEVFFTAQGNLNGFDAKQATALDLATSQGYAGVRAGFLGPGFDYGRLAEIAGLERVAVDGGDGRFAEIVDDLGGGDMLDDRTIVMFTIAFEPNQNEFDIDDYGLDFQRAVQQASTFGNAVIAIRGHSDPTKVLSELIRNGMNRGLIKRQGSSGTYRYFYNGKALDLTDTTEIVRLIESGAFAGGDPNPQQTMQAALNLSRRRAEAVKAAIARFAASKGYRLDLTQIQPVGVGVMEPLIAKPASLAEAKTNMRVEFRVMRVPAEAVKSSDFDF